MGFLGVWGEQGGGGGVGEGWVGAGAVSFAGLHLRSSVPKAGVASSFQTTGRIEPRGKIIFCSDRLSRCYCNVGFPSLHNEVEGTVGTARGTGDCPVLRKSQHQGVYAHEGVPEGRTKAAPPDRTHSTAPRLRVEAHEGFFRGFLAGPRARAAHRTHARAKRAGRCLLNAQHVPPCGAYKGGRSATAAMDAPGCRAWTMTSSENNLDSNNGRPFVVHTVAQQPYPSFWYQNPAYNPFCVPGAGSRNGSLYFPCSVVPSEYPSFLVPQSPLPTTLNRRPGFPMCYHPAQFWHYSGYARKMKTQETQTELQQEQHNGISQNSCESLGVPNNPQEGEDLI
ncbi:uncharacterized protein LOC117012089 [Rhinolophus ferrumequinum]|uniref:uncharacterized protein LOC117012089 n=1 Tax=Rhinolophus ferrumequinum TaxID=59479 RepID=UPI00140F51A5|nr:uncharacterized protein LOC117012089 [Rhinolophus ferrumequinum]